MSLLTTHQLTAHYADFQALFGIDFHIDAGETVAIIGANGAGKSTFLRSIAGVIATQNNSVMFDGDCISGQRAAEVVKRGISLVPEGRRLFASLTVEENLLMGQYSHRGGTWNLDNIYALFPKLKERRGQMASSMSGGEQQMVAIGRALMSNPRLLMCDELSLGLAPKIIGELYLTLADIRARGIAMIIVEQDIHRACAAADRVYCFQEGRVSLEGKPADLTQAQISTAYFGV